MLNFHIIKTQNIGSICSWWSWKTEDQQNSRQVYLTVRSILDRFQIILFWTNKLLSYKIVSINLWNCKKTAIAAAHNKRITFIILILFIIKYYEQKRFIYLFKKSNIKSHISNWVNQFVWKKIYIQQLYEILFSNPIKWNYSRMFKRDLHYEKFFPAKSLSMIKPINY